MKYSFFYRKEWTAVLDVWTYHLWNQKDRDLVDTKNPEIDVLIYKTRLLNEVGANCGWAGRDLYRAISAMTRALGLHGLRRRITLISRLTILNVIWFFSWFFIIKSWWPFLVFQLDIQSGLTLAQNLRAEANFSMLSFLHLLLSIDFLLLLITTIKMNCIF